jgi:hypothetical protein
MSGSQSVARVSFQLPRLPDIHNERTAPLQG